MRLARCCWLVLSAFSLLACGSDDGESSPTNTAGSGGAISTGGTGGSGGSGKDPNCKPRCEARAIACGVSINQATNTCASLCTSLTSAQLNCLEKSSCDDLNSGAALSNCGISGGAGQGGGGQSQGGESQGGAGTSQGGSGQGGKAQGGGGSTTAGQGGSTTAGQGGSTAGTGGSTIAGAGGQAQGGGGQAQGGGGQAQGGGGQAQGGAGSGGSGGSLQEGDPQKILLKGTVIGPMGPFVGQVLVEGEKITCVEPGDVCAGTSGASGATVITTGGIISPGLIDMHNHILFDIFDDDDWMPEKAYTNHNQWTKEVRYGAMLDVKQCFEDASQGKPTWCPEKWHGGDNSLKCEMNKWGETKGLLSGTTSIVGLIGNINACVGSLARTIGTKYDSLPGDEIQSSALVPSSASSANNVCKNFESGKTKSYVIHAGEGTDAAARGEFEKLRKLTDPQGCLFAPQTAITHGNSFGATELQEMADKGMKLVWSPRSNISLYGNTPTSTTNIPLARSLGILVALGPDWSMGGSVNMLDEIRFAENWDNTHWNNILSPKDLFEMATINAAKILALDTMIGSLKTGFYADLFVFEGDTAAPYDALLGARPTNVKLTMVGGRVLYGDPQFKPASLTPSSCEDLQVCGASKFVCVAEANSSNKLEQTFSVIKTSLEEALLEVDAIPTATKGHSYTFAPLAPLSSCP